MKNSNKKGFTIVELVIVIAVIAILAAVLIPTFSSVINKANDSAALQKAQNALQVITINDAQEINKYDYYFVVGTGNDAKTFVYEGTKGSSAQMTKGTKPDGAVKYYDPSVSTNSGIDTDVQGDLQGLGVTIYRVAGTTSSAESKAE